MGYRVVSEVELPDAKQVLERALRGERRWLARAVTWIERRALSTDLDLLSPRRRDAPGAPHVIGITGPPGAGKSTFVDRLVTGARARGARVAVVAVDPSSPFSGGAILGDRIRMERHTGDDGVYVRSLSSRGHLGGLSTATAEVVDLLDAAGFDLVLVETVGVGQSELGVIEVADTAVVVLTPESGDTVQTMKAGLLEIADVFVVNKADRPGADRLARELSRSVDLSQEPGWRAPVLTASALEQTGVEAVVEAAQDHLAWCCSDGLQGWRRRRGDAQVRLFLDLVGERARRDALENLGEERLAALRSFELSPRAAALEYPC